MQGQRRFGTHLSIAGGLHRAFERAVDAGCDCLQVFVKNQRQWRARPIDDAAVALWRQARDHAGIGPVVAHACYLINLAAPDDRLWHKSIAAFIDELERCAQLGIDSLIIHPGSHNGHGESWGLRRIARALNVIHRHTAGLAIQVLLETTAGQGTSLGYRFEQLAEIIEQMHDPRRVGVCLDTCHIFAAGYDLTTDQGYAETMASLDQLLGTPAIRCFHVNDSRKPLGSRVDRHEHIGKGCLGRRAFARLINDERFLGVPMILETPKGVDHRGRDLDRLNLAALRRLVSGEKSHPTG